MKKAIILMMFLVMVSSVYAVYIPEGSSNLDITFLNQDPDPAEPGEYLELRWQINKIGNQPLEDVTFLLKPEYPFYFDGSDSAEKIITKWSSGYTQGDDYYTLYYKLRVDEDALEDTYELELDYRLGNSNLWTEKEFDIRVADKNRPDFIIGDLSTSPIKLISDTEEASFEVSIDNIGDGDAENVVVEIEFPDGFRPSYAYSDRATLGTVASETSETATFYADLDEDILGGIYKAQITINYKEGDDDENVYKTAKLTLDIPVNDRPLFEITDVSNAPSQISPGDDVELKFTVKNIGTEKAESVSLRAFKESSQPFEFDDKSDFIGKLGPGETGEALLKFTVEKTATPKKYIVDIEIRSVFEDEVIIQEKTAVIEVGDGEKSGVSPIVGVLVVLAIVIIGIILYRMLRGKKKRKN